MKEILVVDEVVECDFEAPGLVAFHGADERVVNFHVFENFQDKVCRVQETEDVVEQHLAAAVDECLMFADEALEAYVVEDVFKYLGRCLDVACDNGDIAFGRVAE